MVHKEPPRPKVITRIGLDHQFGEKGRPESAGPARGIYSRGYCACKRKNFFAPVGVTVYGLEAPVTFVNAAVRSSAWYRTPVGQDRMMLPADLVKVIFGGWAAEAAA